MISLHRVFTLYLTWGTFSLVCNLSVVFFLFPSSFSLFLSVCFYTNDSLDSRERRGNHYFSSFQPPPANKLSISSLRFLPLFLPKLIVIPRLIAYETCFPGRFAFFLAFLLMQLRRSYWLWHFKVTLWGFELISNYHPSIAKRTP